MTTPAKCHEIVKRVRLGVAIRILVMDLQPIVPATQDTLVMVSVKRLSPDRFPVSVIWRGLATSPEMTLFSPPNVGVVLAAALNRAAHLGFRKLHPEDGRTNGAGSVFLPIRTPSSRPVTVSRAVQTVGVRWGKVALFSTVSAWLHHTRRQFRHCHFWLYLRFVRRRCTMFALTGKRIPTRIIPLLCLKASYWKSGQQTLNRALASRDQPSLLSLIPDVDAA